MSPPDLKTLEDIYWNVRAVIETARTSLESPHPLWGYLNELMENADSMEQLLDIPNRMDKR